MRFNQNPPEKKRILVLKVIFGISLLLFLFAKVELQDFIQTFAKARIDYCFLGFALFGIMGITESLRLLVALKTYSVSFTIAVYLYLVGMFFANFMPGNVGTEVYKIYYLNRLETGLNKPIAMMFLLRISGLIVLLLMLMAYLPFNYSRILALITEGIEFTLPSISNNLRVALVLIFVILFLVFMIFKGSTLSAKIKSQCLRFFGTLGSLSAREYAWVFFWSFATHVLRMLFFYCFIKAFNADILLPDLIPVAALVVFASFLPISFASLGVREGAIVGSLMVFGISSEIALSVAVLARCALLLISLVGWGVFIGSKSKAENFSQ